MSSLGPSLISFATDTAAGRALRTTGTFTSSPNGSVLFGIEWIAVRRLLNSPTQEEYRFFDDALDGNLVVTITINYTDSTLDTIDTVVRF